MSNRRAFKARCLRYLGLPLLLAGMVIGLPAASAQDFVAGEIVVGFRPEAQPAQIAAMESQLGLALKADFANIRAKHYRLPAQLAVEQALPLVLQFGFVAYAEPNFLQKRQAVPTDPRYPDQWYLRNTGQIVNGLQGTVGEDINWQAARDLFSGTREIIVAVVDTGLALEHPDLANRIWNHPAEYGPGANGMDEDGNGLVDDRAGWDFYDGDATPRDENGHGTLVASLIGGQAENAQGGVGVSPTARLMALRVGNDFGSIPVTSAISAFTYAAKRGAKVINFSAGGTAFSNSMLATIQWLATKGVLLVAAAGNGGSDGIGDNNDVTPTYPAAYAVANIIAVAALDQNGNLAGFSNYGASGVHIAAPGTNMFGAAIRTSTHYFENFETGAPGWTQGQLSGSQSSLSWGLYADAGSNHWFGDSLSGSATDINYQANTNSGLVSPPLSLVGVTGAQLSARLWYQLESGRDFGYVEISEDNGASWNFIASNSGFSFGACPGCGGAGSTVKYDLSRYEGKTIRIRFRVQTDAGTNYKGLFIDDVRITKVEPFLYDGTQYQFLNGTSFSAPLVAGAAAMVWSQRPDLSLNQVRQILLSSARVDARLSGKVSTGGRLDVYAALQAALATPNSLTITPDFAEFTKIPVGTVSAIPRTITLGNPGTQAISVNIGITSSAGSSPTGFQGLTNSNCSSGIPAGGTCVLSLDFAPPQAGEIDAVLTITSSASGSPHVINLLGVGTVAASSTVYATAGYLPLIDNATRTYLKNGVPYTSTVLPGTVVVNGNAVKQIHDSDDNAIGYVTNDANGILEHGGFAPSVFVPGFGNTSSSFVLSPPAKHMGAQVTLGQNTSASGAVSLTYTGVGTFPLSYTLSATPVSLDTVTVNAGMFKAVRVDYSYRIFGPIGAGFVDVTTQGSEWYVDGLGLVKDVYTENDGSTVESKTVVLTASSMLDATPNAFAFPPVAGVLPGTQITSVEIAVSGINAGVGVSVTGGEYSVDGGAWTAVPGTVFSGQGVRVRQTASGSYAATTNATLTVSGISAAFAVTTAPLVPYPVTVLLAGSGTVSSNPAGISCGATCTANYQQGTTVTLTATPAANYSFAGWTGACTGTGSCVLIIDAAKNVSASFAAIPDTQAPTVPQGLVATAVGASQIKLRWNTSSDNIGVTQYRLYRDGVPVATLGFGATASDTGLSPVTAYSYAVSACDAAGNCSAQSATASATTLAAGQYAYVPELESGWNLAGNALNIAIDVAASFGNPAAPVSGVTENVASVWKWNAVDGRWAFYTPQLGTAALASYAASHGYEVLATISVGEGYWVNAINPLALPTQSGTGVSWNGFSFGALPSSWNLIAAASGVVPSVFNSSVTVTPPSPGVIPTDNFVSLWAWDAPAATWYFYAPSLESSGGLAAVKAYADSHNLRHFEDYNKALGVGMGFWVNRP